MLTWNVKKHIKTTANHTKSRREPRRSLCVFLYVTLCTLCGSNFCSAQSKEFSLNSDSTIHWQFRKAGDTLWYDATIPGCVHTDLLDNKLIPDPFYRDNESKVQWVENEDWEYQTFFDCPNNFFLSKHLELHFDGLGTYADVYLNDSLILSADNMFRSWNVDVKQLLKEEGNHLLIHFYSSVKKGKELAAQLGYKLPGDDGGKALMRKAQYHFGWDWGPRLVTCGVWKDVKLVGWKNYILDNLFVENLEWLKVTTAFRGNIYFERDGNFFTEENIWTTHYDGNKISSENDSSLRFTDKIPGPYTKNSTLNYVRLHEPHLWWINGNGEPFRYLMNFQMINWSWDSVPSVVEREDIIAVNFGIRNLTLNQKPDSLGSTFYFQLNGHPLFIKGANLIPPDNFLSRVTIEDYKRLVDDAVVCHMNMLRVWGGGAYLPDEFYDYCDEKGILIWQDFMFANAMVPGDSAFVENVKQEAIDQVIRLRNHPCIALWCGNNEIDEAWHNWGYHEENKSKSGVNEKIWNDYKRIFDTILPQVVEEYDPGRAYIPSSPKFGWGHKESLQQGDSHYWGVWWGEEPFSSYETHVGRFMSEYGFQSLPSMVCFYEFASPDDWKQIPTDKKSASEVLNVHQKHPRGYELIHEYMQRDYKVPDDFEKYVYVSQLLQRDGMATAIEAHRRAKPYCMGTMYWQLNDCWPVTSWSGIDYYGNWKALQYALKRDLYKTFLISMKEEDDQLKVYVVSDSLEDVNARLRIELMSFDGKEKNLVLDSIVHIEANSSKLFTVERLSGFLKPGKSSSDGSKYFFIHADLSLGEETIATKNFFIVKPRDLELVDPHIQSEARYSRIKSPYEGYSNVYIISLRVDAFAKDVFLSYDFEDVKFSDNFFDMLPGEERTVFIYSKEAIDHVNLPLKVISLKDCY